MRRAPKPTQPLPWDDFTPKTTTSPLEESGEDRVERMRSVLHREKLKAWIRSTRRPEPDSPLDCYVGWVPSGEAIARMREQYEDRFTHRAITDYEPF